MAAAAADLQADSDVALVGAVDGEGGRLSDQALLGQGSECGEPGQLGQQPLGAEAALLLVAGQQQDERPEEAAMLEAPRLGSGQGEEALHVGDAAAHHPVADTGQSKRVAGPAGLVGEGHHVHVSGDHQPARGIRAGPGDEVGLRRPEALVPVQLDAPAGVVEQVGEVLGAGDVGRSRHRVEAGQALEDLQGGHAAYFSISWSWSQPSRAGGGMVSTASGVSASEV